MTFPLREFVELAPFTTLGVGGPARYFVEATDENTVLEALRWAKQRGIRVRVLGGGSNVVVSDGGFDGLVLHVRTRGIGFFPEKAATELRANAGEPWDEVVAECVRQNLQGVECLSGIPGLLGATPIQNVGAYGQEVSETIVAVRVFDREKEFVREFAASECRFAYRNSFFKSEAPERFVVLGCTFRLTPGRAPALRYAELKRHFADPDGPPPGLAEVRSAVLALRRKKSMVWDAGDENHRSCGSFFVNPMVAPERAAQIAALTGAEDLPQYPQPDGRVKLAAGWLIEKAGFQRGTRAGAVGLSSRHALAIVCHDGARASDVFAFARTVQAGVKARFDVELEPEPVFWS